MLTASALISRPPLCTVNPVLPSFWRPNAFGMLVNSCLRLLLFLPFGAFTALFTFPEGAFNELLCFSGYYSRAFTALSPFPEGALNVLLCLSGYYSSARTDLYP